MLIDWFTVAAQVLNFLLLVWLMKRFLYQPILRAIDAREQRIAHQLADATAKDAEAERQCAAFKSRNDAFDRQHDARLQQLSEEIATERQRLLAEARAQADALTAMQREALRTEVRSLNQTIARRASQEVLAAVRKTMVDLAGASLEEQMTHVFIRRLRALGDAGKATLAEAILTGPKAALVRSAFELPSAQRAALKSAFDETFKVDIGLRFETAPALVSGIEWSSNGQKLAWSIDAYLGSLEKSVDELLEGVLPAGAPSASVRPGTSGSPARSA